MKKGFTLVELAIVLVIIGFVIGGVFAGNELIKSSKNQKFISEIIELDRARTTFQLKYNQLPGDFDKATAFFSSGVGNGDNNGLVSVPNTENVYFWEHLDRAELIEGTYDGVRENPYDLGSEGTLPVSKAFDNVGFYAFYSTIGVGADYKNAANNIYDRVGHAFGTGTNKTGSTAVGLPDGFLDSYQASEIDTKMDDGSPDTGKVFVISEFASTSGCIDVDYNATAGTANFDFTDEAPECRIVYWWDY